MCPITRRVSGLARPCASHIGTLPDQCPLHPLWPIATIAVLGDYDIKAAQELLGHRDVNTTLIYAPVLNRSERGVQSPADGLTISLPSEWP